jgi:hypothetical protein
MADSCECEHQIARLMRRIAELRGDSAPHG